MHSSFVNLYWPLAYKIDKAFNWALHQTNFPKHGGTALNKPGSSGHAGEARAK
jgi:hypothetical protein